MAMFELLFLRHFSSEACTCILHEACLGIAYLEITVDGV
jgi:hypothetical protein